MSILALVLRKKKPVALSGVAGGEDKVSTAYRFALQAEKKKVLLVIYKSDQSTLEDKSARNGRRGGGFRKD